MQIKGLRYSDTVETLKLKLFKVAKLRPSETEIKKDGDELAKEHCSLVYYAISHKTLLEAVSRQDGTDRTPVRLGIGYRVPVHNANEET